MVFPYLLHVSLPQGNTRVFLLALTSATQEWHSERQSSSEIYRMLQAAGFEAKCLVEKFFLIFGCLWKTNTRVTKMKECRAFFEASIHKLWFITTNYVNSRKDELLASTEMFIFSF